MVVAAVMEVAVGLGVVMGAEGLAVAAMEAAAATAARATAAGATARGNLPNHKREWTRRHSSCSQDSCMMCQASIQIRGRRRGLGRSTTPCLRMRHNHVLPRWTSWVCQCTTPASTAGPEGTGGRRSSWSRDSCMIRQASLLFRGRRLGLGRSTTPSGRMRHNHVLPRWTSWACQCKGQCTTLRFVDH